MKKQNLLFPILAVAAILNSSCNYYMVSSVRPPAKKIEQQLKTVLQDPSRYFILHTDSNTYSMNQIRLDSVKGIISFKPDTVASNHMLYIQRQIRGSSKKRYVKVNGEKPVLTEVHIYSRSFSALKRDSVITIPVDQIDKIDIVSKDASRTGFSYLLGFTLPTVAIIVLVAEIGGGGWGWGTGWGWSW